MKFLLKIQLEQYRLPDGRVFSTAVEAEKAVGLLEGQYIEWLDATPVGQSTHCYVAGGIFQPTNTPSA